MFCLKNQNAINKKSKWIFLLALIIGFSSINLLSACAKRKKNNVMQETTTKPMRPIGTMYSAYDPEYAWALEMELDGQFNFVDYNNNIEVKCEATSFSSFSENEKQGLEWIMKTADDLEVRFRVLEENCFNFGFNNNPMIFELRNEHGVLYRVGGCGSYHNPFGFDQAYVLSTINNEDFRKESQLTEAPQITFSKIKTSSLIEGRFGCRTWRSQFNLLDRTLGINFDIYPNTDCYESPELSLFIERIGGKPYFFVFSDNNNKLTLSDKNDTFVFLKMK